MRQRWIFALLFLTGCQSLATPGAGNDGITSSIWPLWERYRQCRTEADLAQLQSLRDQLERTLVTGIDPPGWLAALGLPVERHPLRTSVDPAALAADCSLRTAARFADTGDQDEARRLYRQFLLRYQSQDAVYYRSRAQAALRRLDVNLVAQEMGRDEQGETVAYSTRTSQREGD